MENSLLQSYIGCDGRINYTRDRPSWADIYCNDDYCCGHKLNCYEQLVNCRHWQGGLDIAQVHPETQTLRLFHPSRHIDLSARPFIQNVYVYNPSNEFSCSMPYEQGN
jgi:hypothetical protein